MSPGSRNRARSCRAEVWQDGASVLCGFACCGADVTGSRATRAPGRWAGCGDHRLHDLLLRPQTSAKRCAGVPLVEDRYPALHSGRGQRLAGVMDWRAAPRDGVGLGHPTFGEVPMSRGGNDDFGKGLEEAAASGAEPEQREDRRRRRLRQGPGGGGGQRQGARTACGTTATTTSARARRRRRPAARSPNSESGDDGFGKGQEKAAASGGEPKQREKKQHGLLCEVTCAESYGG